MNHLPRIDPELWSQLPGRENNSKDLVEWLYSSSEGEQLGLDRTSDWIIIYPKEVRIFQEGRQQSIILRRQAEGNWQITTSTTLLKTPGLRPAEQVIRSISGLPSVASPSKRSIQQKDQQQKKENIQVFGEDPVWVAQAQGNRPYQEDRFLYTSLGDLTIWAVFDGHGGSGVSEALVTQLPERIQAAQLTLDGTPKSKLLIEEIYLALDRALFDQGLKAGSTAIVVLFNADWIYLINLGDSRGLILNSHDKIIVESKDHKPQITKEKLRIEAAGHFVLEGRVDGSLALSRAFGDFHLKNRSLKDDYLNTVEVQVMIGREAAVSAVPDIQTVLRKPKVRYQVVLGSDGIFDLLSTQRLAEKVRDGQTCEQILSTIQPTLGDNKTLLIGTLPSSP